MPPRAKADKAAGSAKRPRNGDASSCLPSPMAPSWATGVSRSIRAAGGVRIGMPAMGLGTFRAKGEKLSSAVHHALLRGVRLIDTAEGYKNAADIHAGLMRAAEVVPMDDVFIVTKVSKDSMTPAGVRRCVEEQSKLLFGVAPAPVAAQSALSGEESAAVPSSSRRRSVPLDLVLLHWPGTANANPTSAAHAKARRDCYAELFRLKSLGACRSVGVSNFTVAHLEELLEDGRRWAATVEGGASDRADVTARGYLPAVNQVEMHPYHPQEELARWCRAHDVVVQAYTSLGRADEPPRCLYGNWEPARPKLMVEPVVIRIARESVTRLPTGSLPPTAAQVLLAWALAKGYAVVPKSVSPAHIDENIGVPSALVSALQDDVVPGVEGEGSLSPPPQPQPWRQLLDQLGVKGPSVATAPELARHNLPGRITYAYVIDKIPK